MFYVDLAPVKYKDPWNSTFEARKAKLGKGKINLVYLYEAADNSTFRYRVYNMVQALETAASDVTATYFFYHEIDELRRMADLVDIFVICRCRYTHKLNELVSVLKRRAVRVIFDVDDLIFDPSLVHSVVDTLDQDMNDFYGWDFWFAYVARIGEALRLCDYAITTNGFLAARITAYSGLSTEIVPNFLNKEQIDISQELFQKKSDSKFARNGLFDIGYFSGTPSHNKDFKVVEPTLVKLLEKRSDTRLLVVGYLDLGNGFRRFGDRVVSYPLHDFINLQRLVSLVEVNIVPLQDNVFTNCKSELKFFEAAIVGTVTVATPVFSYREAIKHGVNSYLANSYEWEGCLTEIIEGMDGYQDIARSAASAAIQTYSPEKQASNIKVALGLMPVDDVL